MALERTYTIPLRREWLKSPRHRRSKRAVNAVKAFLKRHMKAELENIRIGKYLNLELWKHGIKNPPSKVRVSVVKDDKGIVKAELVGAPKQEPKPEKPGKKPTLEKKTETAEKKPEEKAPEKPAEKKPETKPIEKKEEVKKVPEKKPETKAPEPKKEEPEVKKQV